MRSVSYNIQGQYQKIAGAVERLKAGEWDTEQLLDFLVRTLDELEPKGELIKDTLATPGYRDFSPEECEKGEDGVSHYQEGLEWLMDLLDRGDLAEVRQALGHIKQGNDLINQAMHLNRNRYEDLDIEFFI